MHQTLLTVDSTKEWKIRKRSADVDKNIEQAAKTKVRFIRSQSLIHIFIYEDVLRAHFVTTPCAYTSETVGLDATVDYEAFSAWVKSDFIYPLQLTH